MKRLILTLTVFYALTALQGCMYYRAYIMSKDDIRTKKEQTIGKYKLIFTSRQGWAGPVYYRYDLKKKSIFGFYNSKIYVTTAVKDTGNCQIDFYKKGEIKYRTDKCKQTVEKLR